MAKSWLKWVGAKGRIAHELVARLPPDADRRRHVEPFVGSGALFFARQPQAAILADDNGDLINTYRQVRDNTEALIRCLQELATDCSEGAYYAARDEFNELRRRVADETDGTRRAALFIYLNKNCFNGIYRVNLSGEFNVPHGRYKNPKVFDASELRDAATLLHGIRVVTADFRATLEYAESGDFVYLDPPYEPLTRTANFTAYTPGGFSQDDQRRLRDVFRELSDRGCYCMLSNSDTPFIRELYNGFHIDTIQAPRAVSCKGDSRKAVSELVIRNYG